MAKAQTRLATYLAVWLVLALASARAAEPATAPRIKLGILPTFDLSGETHSDIITQNLTYMIFQKLRNSEIEPVLLNPGGGYTPLVEELILEFGRLTGVDAVLVTVYPRSHRPRSGSWSLSLQAYLIETDKGRRSHEATLKTNISRRDYEVGLYAPTFWGGRKDFEKQPLGKAAGRLATAVQKKVLTDASLLASRRSGSVPVAGGGTCPIDLHVAYLSHNASSKVYNVAVNDREESIGVKDGAVKVSLNSGPVIVRLSVQDAPYRLPVQRLYQANTFLDCAIPEKSLVLEIGPAGEAFLVWR